MKTVNDLIKELQKFSEEKRNKPINIVCPNGIRCYPKIRYVLKDKYDVLNFSAENIEEVVLTWE